MNTLQLKNRILDLAIHGKLVPQDPNDEPASLLLERIKEEKARLVREKKIKKQKEPKQILGEVYKLPSNWVWTTIGDIFYLHAGRNISAGKISSTYSEIFSYPCYGGNGIRGYVDHYSNEGLINIIGRQGALCGNVNLAKTKFYATEHAVVVETFGSVDVEMFYYFLKSLNLNQFATSVAQPGLAVGTINEVRIPLPPLAEQHRIVAEIEKWMKLVDIIESNQTGLRDNIDKTKAKILDKYISGHLTPFNNIAELISGRDLERSEFNNDKDGIPYITGASNVVNGHLIINRWTEYPKVVSNKGDILLSCKGTIGELVINTIGQIHIARQFMAIRPKNDIDIKYLYYAMKSIVFQIIKMSHGVIPGISRKDIIGLSIPLPSLNEQHRIVAKVEELFAALDKMRKCIVSS